MMVWLIKKKPMIADPAPRFDHLIGTIRVTQYPDGRWRCQSYGMPIPADKPYYIPAWVGIIWPPGNEVGFESEAAAIVAWRIYSERKNQADRILFTPPTTETEPEPKP